MRVGLIDVDGHNYPNLPLMKISAFHKREGDQVEWYRGIVSGHVGRVYMSKVFSFTPDYIYPIDADEIIRGGSGYAIELDKGKEIYRKDRDPDLPDEVEHIFPDYSLYPQYTGRALGFLSRGCPRGCKFCHVAAKEGRCSYKVADLSEFWNGQKEIVLMDPNILACRDHRDLLQQLADSGAAVDINQGLDIRLINDNNVDLIRAIKIKYIHFAFDRYEDAPLVIPKLEMFQEATGFDHHKVGVYILTNFDTTIEQDLERIYSVRDIGFTPYVMVYDRDHCDQVHKDLQRWANNQRIFRTVKQFENFDVRARRR